MSSHRRLRTAFALSVLLAAVSAEGVYGEALDAVRSKVVWDAIDALTEGPVKGRAAAARVLGAQGSLACIALPTLYHAAVAYDTNLAEAATWAITAVERNLARDLQSRFPGDESPLGARLPALLIRALASKKPTARLAAVQSLAQFLTAAGLQSASRKVGRHFGDPRRPERNTPDIGKISRADQGTMRGALEVALLDGSRFVRAHAAYALGALGQPAKGSVPKLVAHLRDKDVQVRYASALALSWIAPRPPVAIRVVAPLLLDESQRVRLQAVLLLARHGSAAAEHAPAIVRSVMSSDGRTIELCLGALRAIHEDEELVRWCVRIAVEAIEPDARLAANKLLLKLPVHSVLMVLAKHLEQGEPAIQLRILGILDQFGKRARPLRKLIVRIASEPKTDSAVRRACEQLLQTLEP